MKDRTVIVVAGLLSLVIIECVALSQGINGTYLSIVLTTIGGVIGYSAKGVKDKIQPEG